MELFDTILIHPILNILIAIYQLLKSLSVPYALGFAIILLTIVIRLILYPLTASQLKAAKKMQDMTPHLNKLKERHKGDSKKLQQETMKLYQEHGINPAAGCLPILLQLPIIWALYSVLDRVVKLQSEKDTLSYINNIVYSDALKLTNQWDTTFFGIPLGQTPSQLMNIVGPLILLAPIMTGVSQFIQSKMMLAQKADVKKGPKTTESDFQSAMATQSLYIFPLMIGFFSFNFPFGLSLYWNTFTIFGIIQQYKIQGLGGLTDFFKKKPEPAPVLEGKIVKKKK